MKPSFSSSSSSSLKKMLELHSSSSVSSSPSPEINQRSNRNDYSPNVNSMLSMINLNLQGATKQLNFLNQSSSPLTALHSMSDLKLSLNTSLGPSNDVFQNNKNMFQGLSSPSSPISNSTSTSHYINDILNRPTSSTTSSTTSNTTFTNALAGSLPKFPLANVSSSVCFSAAAAAAANGFSHKIGSLNDLQSRHIYWPSVVQNSSLWRERFANAVNQSCTEKDGKKKHTRPTFSGHQIYVLEKTFEQTKYLAGPERAKLAYALGMSESQVKVWFQNRRTKWRKRHAAELATAKKKNPGSSCADLSAQEDDFSSDEEISEKLLKNKHQQNQFVHNTVRLSHS